MTNSTPPAPTTPAPARARFRAPGMSTHLALTPADMLDIAGDAHARSIELFGVTFTRRDN